MQLQRHAGSPEAWIDPGPAMLDGPQRDALLQAAGALDRAERLARPHEMAAALAQLGRCYRSMGAHRAAEHAFGQALRWTRGTDSVDAQVELLGELAQTACSLAEQVGADDPGASHAAFERARDWAFEAARLSAGVADAQWEVTVLLHISDTLNRCGDHDDALALATRALSLMAGVTATDA